MARFRSLCQMAGLLNLASASCLAQIPKVIPFQALLTNRTGQPITNASQTITLSLYSGNTAVYTESQTVPVTKGILSTTIGNGNPAAFAQLTFGTAYTVGVKVGSDPEMTPRLPLAAVPYAYVARSIAPGSVLDGAGISGASTLEFGAGIAGKEGNAGKIGYGTFTVDTLDIVGAGAIASERRVKIHAEGGTSLSGNIGVAGSASINGNLGVGGSTRLGSNVNVVGWFGIGDITAQAPLHVKGNGNVMLLEGADHAYIEYYPYGFFSGRKAYIGFPSGGSDQLVIANESGGPVRVIGPFINNSDARYKTAISPLANALDSVLRLRGVSYDWRHDLPEMAMSEQRQIGFLAQDVEKVLPELVYTDKQGMKSVAYLSVIPVLVEALKEQQREIDTLRAKADRTEDLENRLRRLEQQLAADRESR